MFALLFSAATPMLGGQSDFAQALPISLPGPLGDLLAHPSQWLVSTFDDAVAEVGRRTTTDVLDFMNWLLGTGNIVSQTPPALSYDSDVVRRLWGSVVVFANVGLAGVTAFAGLNAMIRPHLRAPYQGALEVVPRIVLCAILVNTGLLWGHFAIDLNYAMCQVQLARHSAWTPRRKPASARTCC
jgi:hypothetical protein